MAQSDVLATAKLMMPSQFLARITDDNILLAYLNLVTQDFNSTPPSTAWTLDTLPSTLQPLIAFGFVVYSNLFLQAGYALEDFSYSDNGLSLNINRYGNLGAVYIHQYENYKRMVSNNKKIAALRVGLSTSLTRQFNSVVAQYLGVIYPGTSGTFS